MTGMDELIKTNTDLVNALKGKKIVKKEKRNPLEIALAFVGFSTIVFTICYTVYRLLVREKYKDIEDIQDEFEE